MKTTFYLLAISHVVLIFTAGCNTPSAPQWEEIEIILSAERDYKNPYTDVDVHIVFTGPDGLELKRPAFWDEENTWKVRFASPVSHGNWQWTSYSSEAGDGGLNGRKGELQAVPYSGSNPLTKKGLLRMSPGRRNVIHADGTPFLVIGDTPWALPFRGTVESVTRYARNRQDRGFNTALLMSVQPDMRAEGPRNRNETGGFGVAFEDLKDGHLIRINPDYFQTLDTLVSILLEHGIVPAWNPVFQGYGWKGLSALGAHAEPEEYSRYTKYLIARYGARPAFWLVSADGTGRERVTEPAGIVTNEWDAYRQPAGIHYSPFCDRLANWSDDPQHGFHYNRSYQEAEWLDFQWAQTGHGGEHLPYKVFDMYDNMPVKASANGEPTYERIGRPDNATGWWQGHEAWINITSGGTMGHVYGAGGLWNWKLAAGEPGWENWANTHSAWYESIEFEGSRYVGFVPRAFDGLDFTDIERRHDLAGGHPALAREGKLYIVYLREGGTVSLGGLTGPLPYRWFNPKTGQWAAEGMVSQGDQLTAPGNDPWVLIAGS